MTDDKTVIKKAPIKDWFVLVSAFHKSLRRGDVAQSIYWGVSMGYDAALKYLKSIVTEETRSVGLVERLMKIAPTNKGVKLSEMVDAITLFCIAVKRWEVPYALSFFETQLELIEKRAEEPEPPTDLADWKSKWVDGGEVEDFLRAAHALSSVKQNFTPLYKQSKNPHVKAVVKSFGSGYHTNLFVMQIMSGLWQPEQDFLLVASDEEVHAKMQELQLQAKHELNGKVYEIPDYAYDKHTRVGKAKYNKMLKDNNFTHYTQPTVDMRYSGTLVSGWWRALAFSKFGSIDVPWIQPFESKADQDWFYRFVAESD